MIIYPRHLVKVPYIKTYFASFYQTTWIKYRAFNHRQEAAKDRKRLRGLGRLVEEASDRPCAMAGARGSSSTGSLVTGIRPAAEATMMRDGATFFMLIILQECVEMTIY